MKKKVLLLTVMLPLVTAMLFSCKLFGKDKDKDKENENNTQSSENIIFKAGYAPDVVYYSDGDAEMALELCYALGESTGVVPGFWKGAPKDESRGAIYVGRLDNDLSKKAYERLDRVLDDASLDNEKEDVFVGYLIYSDGKSVAIAYSEDLYDSTKTRAVEYFTENYIREIETLTLEPGYSKSETYGLFEFLEEVDEKYYEKAWDTLLLKAGNPELVTSLKHLKELYKNNTVSWLANLYDEEIGGFYYSNSGRDNVGFLPDVDSTYQAIVLMGHMGLHADFGYGGRGLPADFWHKVGLFAKGLQDENGFFYHPQWTKELVDSKLSRRARDLIRAQALLSYAGMQPTYNTPDGGKGDGLVWDYDLGAFVPLEELTSSVSRSTVSAVSKVMATAAYVPDHLVSEEALHAYLNKFVENGTNFYTVNNELANQTSQIAYRDVQLAESGANWRAVPIVIDFLNKHQNPLNGTWSQLTNYNAVDGLFKAAHVYTAFGCQIPYAKEAAITALNAITSEQVTTHICNIYNCWCTLQMVMQNMKKFGSTNEANVILQEVRRVAAPSIEATLVKYLDHQKEDGSFSYYKDRCSAESQGMQLAIQCNEGDMNATSLTYSVWGTIFSVLGLEEYEVSLHASADYAKFISMIDGIGGVIKNPAPEPKPITFDDETIGTESYEVSSKLTSPGSSLQVVADSRSGAKGNVLRLISNPGGGDTVIVPVDTTTLGTCFIFEGEFCIADSKNDYVMQINLGASAYMLNLKLINATDERGEAYKKVQILESSSQGSPRIERDLGISSRLGEWFKIRLEYYVGTHDSVRIKVYFNDTLAAVSNNYYDHSGVKIKTGTGSPNKYYSYTQINVMSGQTATVLMDNLFVSKTDDRFVPAHDVNNQPLINDDPPVRDEVVYDFENLDEGKNYPDDFSVTENSGSVEVIDTANTKKLNIKTNGEKTLPTILIPAVIRGPKTNCAVFETDVIANSGSIGSALNVRLRANDKISGDTGSITAFNLEIVEKDGETFIAVADAPNGATVSIFEDGYVKIGTSFKLRLEHYESENVTLIYIDGSLIASSDMLTTGGGNRVFMRAEISVATESTIDVSVDNMKAERIVKSFIEATKPAIGEKIYDFESEHGDITTDGKVIKWGESLALKLSDGNALTLPLNVRAVITNFVSFRANTAFGSTNEAVYRLAFTTESGAYVLAFELVPVGGNVFVYEFTENGRAVMPIASFTPESGTELKINYYPSSKVCQIFYGENCIAVTSVIYSADAAEYAIEKMTAKASVGALILDNCVLESYNVLFVEKTPIGDNTEDEAERITFESSSTGNLPRAVTKKLYSLGASVRIEELLDKQSNATKALVFSSTADTGGDEVAFKITDAAEGEWNALVFEADLAFRADNLNRLSYQVFFEDVTDSENTRQYLTSITHGDGKVKIKDYSYGSSSTTVEIDGQEAKLYRNDGPLVALNEPSAATEWFTLRIEIFKGARNEMRILTYINDSLVYVTNNFYRAHVDDEPNDLDKVTQVRFLALTDCEATILIDNVSLVQTTKEIPSDTGDAVVKLYPTTNKPVIVLPEVPDDTDIPEVIDYENGRIYTNTKGEDKNGTEQPKLEIKNGKLYFTSDGGDYLYITPTVKKGSYSHASFEADFTFTFNTDKTSGSSAFYTFSVNDENKKTSFRFNIEYNFGTGEIRFVVYNTGKTYASTVMKKVIGTPGVPTQESVSLNYRIEYYFIGSEAVILNYFDNTLVYAVNSRESQSYVTNDGVCVDYNLYFNYSSETQTSPYGTLGRIDVNSHSGTSTSMSLDNLRFVQDNKTLDESLVAPKPGSLIKGTTGTGVYYKRDGGYEYNISKIWNEADLSNANATAPFLLRGGRYIHGDGKTAAAGLYGYIQPASQGANKVLEYGQESGDVRATIVNLASTSAKGNLYVFETDIVIGSMNNLLPGEAAVSFGLKSGSGEYDAFFENLVITFLSDGTYRLGYSVDKAYSAVMEASTWYNIRVEYYHEEGIARYYLNGERVGSEKIVTGGTLPDYAFASLSIAAGATDAFIRIDNTVVSAYDTEFSAIDGEVDSLATVLPVKGGRGGIAVLIHDDGDLDTVSRLDRIYGKYSLCADVAMVVNRVYDTAAGAPKSVVDSWKTYIDTERWGLINHSFSHTFWGEATADALTVDEEKLYEEVVASGEYLRAAFPSERVLTYAYPGFSSIVDAGGLGYGKLRTYAAAKALIAANYISAREYNFVTSNQPTVSLGNLNYSFLPASSISLGEANLKKDIERIDAAALGGLTVLFSHKVCADGAESTTDTSTVPESYIEAIAKSVSDYVNEGMLWNAHYEDAILYLREASSATVKTVSDGDKITLTLTDTLDDNIYNYALTLEVIVPTSWAGVKVVQGGNTSYARAFERDGKWVVYVDATPDAGDAIITPESANLPEIPTLPCDHADSDGDAECDACGRFYSDPTTCVHKDDDANGKCDKCGADYYDPKTCPHKDSNIDRVCDNCHTTYYDPATCEHIDVDLDAKCDNCGTTYYTEATCPGHKDANGDTVCDTCGCSYADPLTCKHKDSDADSKCDKCETTYYDPATCTHEDGDENDICDKCGKNLKAPESGDLGGTGDDEVGWT